MEPRLLAIALAASSATAPAKAEPAPRTTVLVNARLIDGDGSVVAERGAIRIRAGRFVAVGPAAASDRDADTEVVDLAGRTVIPGLVNAHGHVADTQGLESGPQFYTEAKRCATPRRRRRSTGRGCSSRGR
jgi:imidazolonepropionase-like amidohydrolase